MLCENLGQFVGQSSWFLKRKFDVVLHTAALFTPSLSIPQGALVHSLHHFVSVCDQKCITKNVQTNDEFPAVRGQSIKKCRPAFSCSSIYRDPSFYYFAWYDMTHTKFQTTLTVLTAGVWWDQELMGHGMVANGSVDLGSSGRGFPVG